MSQEIDLTQSDDDEFPFMVSSQPSSSEPRYERPTFSQQETENKYGDTTSINVPRTTAKAKIPEGSRRSNNNTEMDEDSERDTGGIEVEQAKPGHKDPYHGRKFRWWFITWNNPNHPEDKKALLGNKLISYIKFQYEKGKTGTKHYQGVFYLKNPNTCSALRKHFPGCGYMAPVKDTKGAVTYCGKDESRIDGPWEAGTMPAQGTRSDLLECKSIIDGGGRMDDLFEQSFSNAVRYGRGLKSYIDLVDKKCPRTWQTQCYVYYGDSGMGKSEAAKEETLGWQGKTFWLSLEAGMHGKVWWDGYDGEENVVIDEFEQQIRLNDLKRIIDSTPYKVPVKGGSVEFKAKRVWILSNQSPEEWYRKVAPEGSTQRDALIRRLHYVEKFFTEAKGGLGKFQGQASYNDFLDSRWSFVEALKDGTYDIHIKGPGVGPGRA